MSAREIIEYMTGACSLGGVLVARSARGICAVFLGDDAGALVDDLRRRFAGARLVGVALDADFEQVRGAIEAPGEGGELALDARGTDFQMRVWAALRAIPAGETVTYTELARAIGQPTAARAVAGACAANPISVLIPCHRVVRADGGLSGYHWGVERKRALLEREALLGG